MSLSARRAWIEIALAGAVNPLAWSLSARRAWIEISQVRPMIVTSRVALRKESVDRNLFRLVYMLEGAMSLSARRAWIEIISPDIRAVVYRSLSARRAWIEIAY